MPVLVLLLLAAGLCSGEAVPGFARAHALISRNCAECHMGGQKKGHLDLQLRATEAGLGQDQALLDNLAVSLEEHEMPPKKARVAMPEAERTELVTWLRGRLDTLRASRPQDPGLVVVPRLNHDEYNRVITDLTGLTLAVGDAFPRDGGGGEGFSNVGEAQTATPVQVERFLTAAKTVAAHARLGSDGSLVWSDTELPVLARAEDRVGEIEHLWHAWFEVERARLLNDALVQVTITEVGMFHGAYWEAAWRYRHRAALGMPQAELAAFAAAYQIPLSSSILARWYALLTAVDGLDHELAVIVRAWQALPTPGQPGADTLRATLKDLERQFNEMQIASAKDERRMTGESKKGKTGQQAWEKEALEQGVYTSEVELATLRKHKVQRIYLVTATAGDGPEGDLVRWSGMGTAAVPVSGRVVSTQADGIVVQAPAVLAVEVPATGDTQTITATALPDASVQVGLMRDEPKPVPDRLPRLVLGQHERTHALRAARRQVAQATSRTRAEVLSKQVDAMIARGSVDSTPPKDSLSELMPYRLSAAEILNEATPARRATLATLVREHAAWKTPPPPDHRAALAHTALLAFAERAWRGPLSADDRAFLGRVLGTAQKESLGDSGALHRALTVVLVSPRFLYRLQRSQGSEAPYALGEFELASRLSFALWASLPDAQLLRLASEGRLHQPEVIRAEAARMLADPRAAVLAREFGGIWLGYAGFDQLNEVDQQRFPMFTPALRQAMYDEVVLFIDHLLRGEAPVTDIIDARYTWLNEALAKHYGIDGVTGSAMRRVDLPKDSPRGGVMGMAAILTKTAKPLRTSPVLRGDWVLERLLGIDIPPPPANVAMLSDDERDAKGRTLLEQLRVHRDNPACSSCHAKLDPLGLALENYDPIGRWRDQDLNGGPLFTEGAMPDGSVLRGVPGLRAHVQAKRDSVLDGLCRKTVGWFLGRACLPSDRELVARMRAALTANGNRFPAIVAEVVTSPQFLKRRDDLGQEAKP